MGSDLLLVLVVGTALAFDFTNGFHDTANAMATSIATGALKPRVAVTLGAVLNVVGAFLSLAVASTIAKGVVDPGVITLNIVFAGLLGAIAWNLVTWYFGLPSSSSHALIGGVVGATLVAKGTSAIKGAGIVEKVLIPAVLAPLLAGCVAILGTYLVYRLTRRENQQNTRQGFRYGQVATASMLSLAHGTNDAQKTMGVITLALIAHGSIGASASVPTWVILSAALAIGSGTYIGGWRVIRTMGTRITDIESPQGFAADASSAAVILASSHYGFPLSTTHVTSGSIIGSGVGRKLAEVRWGVAGRLLVAWLITLPAAAAVGGGTWWVAEQIGGTAGAFVMAAIAAAGAAGLYAATRKDRVTPDNVLGDRDPRETPLVHEVGDLVAA
ncbi:MAG TPA: anion permease [Gaiellales bacterium]|jgi:PiT family inorganic phosphate transporter